MTPTNRSIASPRFAPGRVVRPLLAAVLLGGVVLSSPASARPTSPRLPAEPTPVSPTAQPATQPAAAATPIIRRNGSSATATSATTRPNGATVTNRQNEGSGLPRVALAMAIVLGLIFVLRWLSKKFVPGAAAGRSSASVKLLGRSVVTPKHQVLLLQVGRRVIVASDNGQQLSRLSEITDADEVASLVGEAAQAREGSITQTFGTMFGRARQPFDAADDDAAEHGLSADVVEPAVTRRERAMIIPPANEADPRETPEQTELSGLAEKVRLLSQQFRRTP